MQPPKKLPPADSFNSSVRVLFLKDTKAVKNRNANQTSSFSNPSASSISVPRSNAWYFRVLIVMNACSCGPTLNACLSRNAIGSSKKLNFHPSGFIFSLRTTEPFESSLSTTIRWLNSLGYRAVHNMRPSGCVRSHLPLNPVFLAQYTTSPIFREPRPPCKLSNLIWHIACETVSSRTSCLSPVCRRTVPFSTCSILCNPVEPLLRTRARGNRSLRKSPLDLALVNGEACFIL